MGTVYNDVTKIRVLPVERITIDYQGGSGYEWIDFALAEQGSTVKKSYITQIDRRIGGPRPVAIKVDVQAFFPYNNFEDMQSDLLMLATRKIIRVYVKMAALEAQRAGGEMAFSFDPADCIAGSWYAGCEQETNDWRPRLTVTAGGLFSLDADAATDGKYFWKQISGF